MSVEADLIDLLRRWHRDEKAYSSQIEEARAKGLPVDCMNGCASQLRDCCKQLETVLQIKPGKP